MISLLDYGLMELGAVVAAAAQVNLNTGVSL